MPGYLNVFFIVVGRLDHIGLLIVGEKEEAGNTVSVRKQGEGDLGSFGVEEFAKIINTEIEKLKN